MFKKLKALFESKPVRADPLPVYRPTRLLPPRPLASPRSVPPLERPSDEFDLESPAHEKEEDQLEKNPSSTSTPADEAPQAKPEDSVEEQPVIQELPFDLELAPADKTTDEVAPVTEPQAETEIETQTDAQGEAKPKPDADSDTEVNAETPAVGATAESESLATDESEPGSDNATENAAEEKSASESVEEQPLLPMESASESDETVAPEPLANPAPEIEASAPSSEAPVPADEPLETAEIAPPPEAPTAPVSLPSVPAVSHHYAAPSSPTSFLPKVQSSARPTPPPVKKHNMLTPTPAGLTPEQLCGVTPNMSPEQVRQRLAFLYRRYNHASSSLNAGLRAEAETALNAIVAVREKHFGPV